MTRSVEHAVPIVDERFSVEPVLACLLLMVLNLCIEIGARQQAQFRIDALAIGETVLKGHGARHRGGAAYCAHVGRPVTGAVAAGVCAACATCASTYAVCDALPPIGATTVPMTSL